MARPKNPGAVVERIRKFIPDVAVRSTFIVGFPGETDEQFEHLAQFIQEYRFNRLGVFTYSRQMEVPSGSMENQVPEKIKKARRKRIMEIQHAISLELNEKLVGKEIDVLVESFDDKKQIYCGRSQWDAPQIVIKFTLLIPKMVRSPWATSSECASIEQPYTTFTAPL